MSMAALSVLLAALRCALGEAFTASKITTFPYRYRAGQIFLLGHQETGGEVNVGRLANFEYKNYARHRRLEQLRSLLDEPNKSMTENERKEYLGLQRQGDPYDPTVFTREHQQFKTAHNTAFAALARYAQRSNENAESCPVFYLDGSDGGTTSKLLECGFTINELYVGNEWEDTLAALQSDPFHLLTSHCLLGSARDVLRSPALSSVAFNAAYFDGCGGMTRPIVEMIDALFAGTLAKQEFAIGFTLTDAEPDGIPLIDRVQTVTREISRLAKRSGFAMHHVGDDPERFGVEKLNAGSNWKRKHGSTCTTWVVCTAKNANTNASER